VDGICLCFNGVSRRALPVITVLSIKTLFLKCLLKNGAASTVYFFKPTFTALGNTRFEDVALSHDDVFVVYWRRLNWLQNQTFTSNPNSLK
jgi:predicted transcriptional regulator